MAFNAGVERRMAAAAASRGMTLIEIMVVIAIIGMVMTAVTVGVLPQFKKAKISTTNLQLNTIKNKLEAYAIDSDLPNSLDVLATGPGALTPKQLKDAWGVDFVYTYPSTDSDRDYDLCSNGPDKRAGTEDDICNYNQ